MDSGKIQPRLNEAKDITRPYESQHLIFTRFPQQIVSSSEFSEPNFDWGKKKYSGLGAASVTSTMELHSNPGRAIDITNYGADFTNHENRH